MSVRKARDKSRKAKFRKESIKYLCGVASPYLPATSRDSEKIFYLLRPFNEIDSTR